MRGFCHFTSVQNEAVQPVGAGNEAVCRGWIVYDGRCGSCRRWVSRWGWLWERRGFRFVPFDGPRARKLIGPQQTAVPEEMKLFLPDGRSLGGAAAVAWLCRRVGWLWPLGVWLELPGIRGMAARVYRWWARHRSRDERPCPVPRADPSDADPLRHRPGASGRTAPPRDRYGGSAPPE